MIVYECTNCRRTFNENDVPLDNEVSVSFHDKGGIFRQLYCPNCESAGSFRVLVKDELKEG